MSEYLFNFPFFCFAFCVFRPFLWSSRVVVLSNQSSDNLKELGACETHTLAVQYCSPLTQFWYDSFTLSRRTDQCAGRGMFRVITKAFMKPLVTLITV